MVTRLFASYFEKLNLPNLMLKRSFYELAQHVPLEDIDPEVTEELDEIAASKDTVAETQQRTLSFITEHVPESGTPAASTTGPAGRLVRRQAQREG